MNLTDVAPRQRDGGVTLHFDRVQRIHQLRIFHSLDSRFEFRFPCESYFLFFWVFPGTLALTLACFLLVLSPLARQTEEDGGCGIIGVLNTVYDGSLSLTCSSSKRTPKEQSSKSIHGKPSMVKEGGGRKTCSIMMRCEVWLGWGCSFSSCWNGLRRKEG
jgi:hypothetical protein